QVLAQLGMLPGPGLHGESESWPESAPPQQSIALTDNAGARFIDDWVRVETNSESPCIWTRELIPFDSLPHFSEIAMRLPLASGEGRFVAKNHETLSALVENDQIPLWYIDNPNGSEARVAGVCDRSGLVFGLMPHPDRYLDRTNHPFWTRLEESDLEGDPPGLKMFRNAVEHAARTAAA
ncbi:MAG: phosphoribosylformylglycinamidine synthase subunit PurQ, partial [Planctomycetota bacterium]|nr:phosphoribosylformylglycinamidine synthase subunit PurQ [Planctomycetota bacterium]